MLANAYGLQYTLPEADPRARMQGSPASNPQMNDIYGQENLLDSDLYVKEGVTDEYYKKVAALKSYANEISSRYGYDVTKPNYKDQESIKFHKTYLESLASLQQTRNELKRLATHENMSIASPNIQMRTDEATNRDFAVNTGESDIIKGFRDTAGKITSQEEADIFNNQVKPMFLEQLEEELSSSQDPREREELKAHIQMVKNIRPDVGMTPAQEAQLAETIRDNKERASIARNRPVSGGKLTQGQEDALGRVQTIYDFVANPTTLDNNGVERFESAAGTFLRKKGEKDSNKWVKFDPNDPTSTLMKLNEFINKDGTTGNVGIDRLNSLKDIIDMPELARMVTGKVGAQTPVMDVFLKDIKKTVELGLKSKAKGMQDNVTPNLVKMLEDGKQIPDEVANKYGSSLSDKSIVSITQEGSGWMWNTPMITIKVPGKTAKTTKSIKLSMSNDEDINVLREILKFNEDRIPRSLVESMMKSVSPQVSSTPTSGPNIDKKAIIDDF